ncbi:Hypothetical predicted protein [Pelobates cultripes]|uniref:Uncharacterized protein n=1 Tax=Pelobates cultripes TaxID=61616 RepID=A0AAD1TNI9_PELCU|nr:Hypothetical predicted protein [Pelobates cultripes]
MPGSYNETEMDASFGNFALEEATFETPPTATTSTFIRNPDHNMMKKIKDSKTLTFEWSQSAKNQKRESLSCSVFRKPLPNPPSISACESSPFQSTNLPKQGRKERHKVQQDGADSAAHSPISEGPSEPEITPDTLGDKPVTEKSIYKMLQDLRSTIQKDFQQITSSIHKDRSYLGERTNHLENKLVN